MEGAAYLVKLRDDPKLEAKFDAIVDVIAAAQEPNGYLYPSHTTGVGAEKDMMGDKPYQFVVHSHELYKWATCTRRPSRIIRRPARISC